MGADEQIRLRVGPILAPVFETVAATTAPPLKRARVAIVTTAGLKPAGSIELWGTDDASFTVLADSDRNLQLSHFSPNFDRGGFVADINVVYPVDRLHELVERGELGSVNSRHLSFMGAQFDLATIRYDTGPAAAKLLVDDGVDVVLLTPV
jgi:D-proline reductase (dithiol) PrdB